MTGIERLLELVEGVNNGWMVVTSPPHVKDIADQIEREHAQTVEDHEKQQEIIRDLQRERDEALREAKWLREQGGAEELDRCLMSKDDADWVGQYGGINGVRDALSNDSAIVLTVIGKLWPDGAPDGIAGNDDIAAELDRRLMPPGIEWPRFESGEKVHFMNMCVSDSGDNFHAKFIGFGAKLDILIGDKTSPLIVENWACIRQGERVKRPAVLAADGEPLEVGQTVWGTDAEADTPLTAVEVSSDLVRCEYTWKDGKTYRPCYRPDQLTHTKPEPIDSWEKLEEDASKETCEYFGNKHCDCSTCKRLERSVKDCGTAKSRDLVRRAKALAERERGE